VLWLRCLLCCNSRAKLARLGMIRGTMTIFGKGVNKDVGNMYSYLICDKVLFCLKNAPLVECMGFSPHFEVFGWTN
jgi:hypothetical protein